MAYGGVVDRVRQEVEAPAHGGVVAPGGLAEALPIGEHDPVRRGYTPTRGDPPQRHPPGALALRNPGADHPIARNRGLRLDAPPRVGPEMGRLAFPEVSIQAVTDAHRQRRRAQIGEGELDPDRVCGDRVCGDRAGEGNKDELLGYAQASRLPEEARAGGGLLRRLPKLPTFSDPEHSSVDHERKPGSPGVPVDEQGDVLLRLLSGKQIQGVTARSLVEEQPNPAGFYLQCPEADRACNQGYEHDRDEHRSG